MKINLENNQDFKLSWKHLVVWLLFGLFLGISLTAWILHWTQPTKTSNQPIPGRYEYVCVYEDTMQHCFVFDTATGIVGETIEINQ